MANSSIVLTLKSNIINAICNDPDITEIIDSKYSGKDLVKNNIFTFNKNPETIKETITFLTVGTDISLRDRNGTFVTPTLSIFIYTHNDHIELPDIYLNDGEVMNRLDYLSYLIDEKFSGSREYGGIGALKLVSNVEFVATTKFLGRKLIFTTIDINDSMCDRGE